ncbi:hypothetical protein ACGVWS_00555 [Enterobacteriaceae bacterium LUAb1]
MSVQQPVILNFDNSAGKFSEASVLDLNTWQERIRFGCSWSDFHRLEQLLRAELTPPLGCVLTGSGDYHHLTYLLLRQLPTDEPVQLIVCDNHPDNMRYPFGIHCGSWVYWASRLPQVAQIHVLGISSDDISWKHAWENHWSALRSGKIIYWSLQMRADWLKWLGAASSQRCFTQGDQLLDGLLSELDQRPVYLSIDKDVLSSDEVRTNWDQGKMTENQLNRLIRHCAGRLVGADITGDVSLYRYQSRFKRWLSAADGQKVPSDKEIALWQINQQSLNQRLLAELSRSWQK